MDARLLYYLAGVPLLGIAAQWLAWRLGLPSILLLLAFGIALGSVVRPDDLLADIAGAEPTIGPQLLFPLVSLAVAVILFEGGLSLRLSELGRAGGIVVRLVTLGALVCWGLSGLAAWWLLGLSPEVAALIGAVLVVTGPTVVGPLLRQIRPARRIGSILKWEGIVIDPIGAVLAVLVFERLFQTGPNPAWGTTLAIVKASSIGIVLGGSAAWVLVQAVKRYWMPDYLHGVVFLSAALAVFAASNWLQHEAGLVTVTVLGVLLANQKSVRIHHVIEFKEHLQVLLISCLFVVLGSRLSPSDLIGLGAPGVLFVAALVLVVRPVSVLVATVGTELSWAERVFLCFLAPRGIVAAAVASVFALRLSAVAGEGQRADLAAQAEQMVPITFLVIVGTVAFYGLLAGPLARRLRLAEANPQGILFTGADAWVRKLAGLLHNNGVPVLLVDTNFASVAAARMEGLPAECVSILSEKVQEELNLGGLGRMLAVTPNDHINTMAVQECGHLFGRAEVYQLASPSKTVGPRAAVAEHRRGRTLFDASCTHAEIERRVNGGSQFKRTALTDEFTYEDFREQHGQADMLLFILSESRRLTVCVAGESYAPRPGQSIIALVPGQS